MALGIFSKKSASDLTNRGLEYFKKGKYDDAIREFDKAIEIDPQYAIAWLNKGMVLLYDKKNYIEALKIFDKVNRLDPQNAKAWTFKGNALIDLGKPDEALQAYDKAIQANPKYAMAWNNKSVLFRIQGKYDEALELVNTAIELLGSESAPESAVIQHNKREIQKKLGISEDEIVAQKPGTTSKNIAKILQRRGISPNELLIAAEGVNGQICLTDKGIIIGREGGIGNKLVVGFTKGEKFLSYRNITGIQFKEPGITAGYIQFTLPGGIESRSGVLDAMSDENTVAFSADKLEVFRKIRDIVEERQGLGTVPIPQAQSPQMPPKLSIADELTKLAALKRDGAITDEEFEQLKKDLLSGRGK